jgi:exodeoxyribonuclease VII small subunit
MRIDMADKKQVEEDSTLTLEENFDRLEETIGRLEEEDISLEEAFAAYSEGMKLLKNCNEQIDRVEKKVLKLAEDGGLEEMQ